MFGTPKWARQIIANQASLNASLHSIFVEIQKIQKGQEKMADVLQAIKDQVTNVQTVDASIIALVQAIAAKLTALGSQPTIDPAEVTAIANQLQAEATSVAAAVTANTPAATGGQAPA